MAASARSSAQPQLVPTKPDAQMEQNKLTALTPDENLTIHEAGVPMTSVHPLLVLGPRVDRNFRRLCAWRRYHCAKVLVYFLSWAYNDASVR
jgi:hypothetical protein